ncbi:hypothetical protein GSI_12001 [Ganoderma sinense ZZ0214-1]|uniref:Uncharacterized protein n=1 Tax=Ganoderma sinense ZZ0214-1 TaxID=1077348 RepID=A0A2G8RXK1_9APHY|nr:hypothetical protein GSI_12001 [Ganoderma sinense ZZ0214-1]
MAHVQLGPHADSLAQGGEDFTSGAFVKFPSDNKTNPTKAWVVFAEEIHHRNRGPKDEVVC